MASDVELAEITRHVRPRVERLSFRLTCNSNKRSRASEREKVVVGGVNDMALCVREETFFRSTYQSNPGGWVKKKSDIMSMQAAYW